jgi:hypothetical protein
METTDLVATLASLLLLVLAWYALLLILAAVPELGLVVETLTEIVSHVVPSTSTTSSLA